MVKLPSKFTEWKLMAEAIKLDALREREEFVSCCAAVLEQAIEEAEKEMSKRKLVYDA